MTKKYLSQFFKQENSNPLNNFIIELNKKIVAANIYVLNNPNTYPTIILSKYLGLHQLPLILHQIKNYNALVNYQQNLFEFIEEHGERYIERDGVTFVKQERKLNTHEIREYMKAYTKFTLAMKAGSCDELAAVGWDFADEMIDAICKEGSKNLFKVDVCTLRNWAHTFLRICYIDPITLKVSSAFYDPWYQLCFSKNPTQPHFFSEQDFEKNMQLLVKNGCIFISPSCFEDENGNEMPHENNFTYARICSTGKFKNHIDYEMPADLPQAITDLPPENVSSSYCNIL